MVKKLVVCLLLLGSSFSQAETIRILNFNTMCSICDSGHKDGPYSQRLKAIANTVARHDPDLASFQEFVSPTQVRAVQKILGRKYFAIFNKHSIFPATDVVLFVRSSRFKILETQGVWLGPKSPHFSFGWKVGMPRRFVWTTLIDSLTGSSFIFAGSHFDNSHVNKEPSAAYVQRWFQKQTLPVIFAGDTNLQPNSKGYSELMGETMRNTFDEVSSIETTSNHKFQTFEFCNDVFRDPWPLCRIDHVLLTKNAPWQVSRWGLDLFRYYKGEKFASDHRAVIVNLIPR